MKNHPSFTLPLSRRLALKSVALLVAFSSWASPVALAREGVDVGGNSAFSQLVPAEGATVPAGPPTLITARFDDGRGSGVDPASVRIVVSGRNVTQEAHIDRESLSFRGALPPGRHTVEVTASDRAGNAVRRSWSFDVAAAAPANLPIRILNHGNNDQVGSGPTLVQGQTVPNANVAVTVNAVAPVVNLSQELLSRTVQADANGNFAFSFVPQYPIPGARYDITMVSTRGNLRDEARLVLMQR